MPASRGARSVAALVLSATVWTACAARDDRGSVPAGAAILLFNGAGTSRNDVVAVEAVLNGNHLDYSTANSAQLNAMSEPQIRAYRLLIVPGGNFIDIGNGLTPTTTANIRNAVQGGVSYLGICAGAFLAGNTGYNSLNLTGGVRFRFYSASDQGIRKAAVAISSAGAPTLEQYWEDGPQFTGWGVAVSKYPDGAPATVQGTFGEGWVVLTGFHPEAPENWRHGMTFATPARDDNAYAATLVHAALNRMSLAHY